MVSILSFYFSVEDQENIFENLLNTHFISNDDQLLFNLNEENLSVVKLKSKRYALEMKKLIKTIVSVTVELQEDMKTMFLNLPSRFHYVFNMRNLSRIFK